ncbi:MAG TPA: hypothetical protein VEP90_20615 [Methylomirabilota bacterium]|nr:hypothetical protein [Methylomirabilota bacterium]
MSASLASFPSHLPVCDVELHYTRLPRCQQAVWILWSALACKQQNTSQQLRSDREQDTQEAGKVGCEGV